MPNNAGSVTGSVAQSRPSAEPPIAAVQRTINDDSTLQSPQVGPEARPQAGPEIGPKRRPKKRPRKGKRLLNLSPETKARSLKTVAQDHARRVVVRLNKCGQHDLDLLGSELRNHYAALCADENLQPLKFQTLATALLQINGHCKARPRLQDERPRAYFIPSLWTEDRYHFGYRPDVHSKWTYGVKPEWKAEFERRRVSYNAKLAAEGRHSEIRGPYRQSR